MADTIMVPISESFNMKEFVDKFNSMYQAKGFNVVPTLINNSATITLDKGVGGINMLLGLGLGITVTCLQVDRTLNVSFSNADWTGKIIGLAVGWFLCLVPFITAIVGSINQLQFPKSIGNDIRTLVS